MKILALEFSSLRRAVAIVEVTGQKATILAQAADQDFRGKPGPSLVDHAMRACKLAPPEIDRIALGLGPGSYTGIRSALAIAQGWQLGRGLPVIGISTADLLAEQCARAGGAGNIQIIIDAQRKEVYSAIYHLADGRPERVRPLEIIPQDALHLAPDTRMFGPEAARLHPQAAELFPDAVLLAELAAREQPHGPAESLTPIYLRPTTFVKAPPPRKY